jgi:hypothetical protein
VNELLAAHKLGDLGLEMMEIAPIDGAIKRRIDRTGRRRGSRSGRPWTGWCIQCLLKNENYIGNIAYNRTTLRLGHKV